jgi:hypothetical protein
MNVANGSWKVFKIVEYVKVNEFPFDTHDETSDILDYFKIDDDLTVKEQSLLAWELGRLAEQAQTGEISRLILDEAEETSRG